MPVDWLRWIVRVRVRWRGMITRDSPLVRPGPGAMPARLSADLEADQNGASGL